MSSVKFAAFVVVAAVLAGCVSSNAVPAGESAPAKTVVSPAAASPLLYVADAGNDDVEIYTWPSVKLDATLTGFGAVRGLCGSKAGAVYVVDGQSEQIVHYKHGGKTPVNRLYDQGYHPTACAIDPLSGRLAVTLASGNSNPGVLAIFTHASGRPVYYGAGNITTPAYCAFDAKGNLYVDGTDSKGNFALDEMAFGYHTLLPVKLNKSIAAPGGLQWDGKYVVVGDEGTSPQPSTLYQLTVNSGSATVEGTILLNDSSRVGQFWIGTTKVFGPDSALSNVQYWPYPAGGDPIHAIGGFKKPVATYMSGGG